MSTTTTSPPRWQIRSGDVDLSRPRIMGVINITPDSFSDGGKYLDPLAACRHAESLVRDGADLLDIGGESSRPGSDPVPQEQELERVIPVIREVISLGVPVSVDTGKPRVAEAALEAGASIVNDVTGLADPTMAPLVAGAGAGLIIMHMKGTPRSMQEDPRYDDVTSEVGAWLQERRGTAESHGVPREAIVLDPGIGFGKRLVHNLELLARLDELVRLGSPILIGVSRKSFIEKLTGTEQPEDRVPGSLAAMIAARDGGAMLFRVHDVAATRQALTVFESIRAV
jgi:dihydropteroate synthase